MKYAKWYNHALHEPLSLVDGDWDIKAPGIPKNDLVTNVRIGKLNGKTRVVIDLNSSAKTRYTLSKDRRMLDVRVDK